MLRITFIGDDHGRISTLDLSLDETTAHVVASREIRFVPDDDDENADGDDGIEGEIAKADRVEIGFDSRKTLAVFVEALLAHPRMFPAYERGNEETRDATRARLHAWLGSHADVTVAGGEDAAAARAHAAAFVTWFSDVPPPKTPAASEVVASESPIVSPPRVRSGAAKGWVVWHVSDVPSAFELRGIEADPVEGYEMGCGESLRAAWPPGATIRVDPAYRKTNKLLDARITSIYGPVISPRLKEFLEAQGVSEVEFLPLTVLGFDGLAIGERFYVNPVGAVDAVDKDASGARTSRADKDFDDVERLVLRHETMPSPPRSIVRLTRIRKAVLVETTLAHAISAAGFTGIAWKTLDAYAT